MRAYDATDRFGAGGAGGWGALTARDEDRKATNGDLFGSAWIRIGLSPRNEFMVGYDSIQLKVKGDPEANRKRIRPVTLGLWTSLCPASRLTPVATVGVGLADLRWMDKNGGKSQTALAAQGGLGLEYFVNSGFGLGVLGRFHYVYTPSDQYATEATAYTLGLMGTLYWGGDEMPAPPVVVAEQKDPTPDPAQSDSDGDGVPDGADWCPETPPGTAVDAQGCPIDSDNDGVLDAADKCPDTPRGSLVNADGCPVEKISVTLDVKFATGKADLLPGFDSALARVADFMKRFPNTTALIEGHTDNVGSAQGNKVLSKKRADAVRKALVSRYHIQASRVTAKGYGAGVPVMDNSAPEGRAANRRVVATLSIIKNNDVGGLNP